MRIALFITCVGDTLFPEIGRATVAVLERLGHEVVFPDGQTCCGQMHANSGYADQAKPMMSRFATQFGGDSIDAVLSPSGSCVAMVRDQYPRLADQLGDQALQDAVEGVSKRVYELSEFLVDQLGVSDVGASYPYRVAYHPSCHGLRVLRIKDAPLQLLRSVRGLTLAELPEAMSCCGFGGTFAVKNADVSAAMLQDKIDAIRQSGAEVCTATDASCLMHIGGGLRRQRQAIRTAHLAEILASTEPA